MTGQSCHRDFRHLPHDYVTTDGTEGRCPGITGRNLAVLMDLRPELATVGLVPRVVALEVMSA